MTSILQLEHSVWQAVINKDRDLLATLFSVDYIEVTADGKRVMKDSIVELSPQVDEIMSYEITKAPPFLWAPMPQFSATAWCSTASCVVSQSNHRTAGWFLSGDVVKRLGSVVSFNRQRSGEAVARIRCSKPQPKLVGSELPLWDPLDARRPDPNHQN